MDNFQSCIFVFKEQEISKPFTVSTKKINTNKTKLKKNKLLINNELYKQYRIKMRYSETTKHVFSKLIR